MNIIPIRPGVVKAPKVDPDLVGHLKLMLDAAERGEIQGYIGGYVLDESSDFWFMAEPEWIPHLSFVTRKGLAQLESDDD